MITDLKNGIFILEKGVGLTRFARRTFWEVKNVKVRCICFEMTDVTFGDVVGLTRFARQTFWGVKNVKVRCKFFEMTDVTFGDGVGLTRFARRTFWEGFTKQKCPARQCIFI